MTAVIELEIIAIASLAALACTIPGTIISMQKNPYIADTAGRSLVLGLAIGFAFSKELPLWSHIPLGGAAAVLGIWLTNQLARLKIMKKSGASVVVSSVMLALGVLILNNFIRVSHADIYTVMTGELAYIPFDRISAGGYDIGPSAIYILSGTLLINILFVLIFYKEIKISAMDPNYGRVSQMMTGTVYSIMAIIVAITVSASFRVTGAFMTTVFILAPALTARFYVKKLSSMIVTSVIICITACLTGFGIAYKTNVIISGTIACVMGAFFIITAFAAPETGIINLLSNRRKRRLEMAAKILAVHIYLNKNENGEPKGTKKELRTSMAWGKGFTEKISTRLCDGKLATADKEIIMLTEGGIKFAEEAIYNKMFKKQGEK